MNASISMDGSAAESLDQAEALLSRRKQRDEEDYREWCMNAYGLTIVGPESFHPADVFDALLPDAARRGRDDASVQVRSDLESKVSDHFPSPIAIPFQSFLEGPRSALSRLQRLRDTWESIVRLLSAIALAEAAKNDSKMSNLLIRDGKDQPLRNCKIKDVWSDKLSVRIGLIDGVMTSAKNDGIDLEIAKIVPVDALAEIRRLNVIRNEFSHASAKSEMQAKEIIDQIFPLLIEVLLDLRDLERVDLIRVKAIHPGNPPQAEVERLFGHSQSRRVRLLSLDDETARVCITASSVDGFDRVLARIGQKILDLSPYIYACDDDTGHRTRIALYKGRSNGKWVMEFSGDSVSIEQSSAPHEALLGSLFNLLGSAGG